jgi:hypothetical protein
MALIIEDGTGVADADSWTSLIDARAIAVKYGLALAVDDDEAEVQLRQAYLALNSYEPQLQGSRAFAIQESIFPRNNVYSNCDLVGSETIPKKTIRAQVYQADSINSGNATNAVDSGEKLNGFDVKGVYSETYQDGSTKRINSTVQGVYNSLYSFTKAGLAASPCGDGGGLYRESFDQEWI